MMLRLSTGPEDVWYENSNRVLPMTNSSVAPITSIFQSGENAESALGCLRRPMLA